MCGDNKNENEGDKVADKELQKATRDKSNKIDKSSTHAHSKGPYS